MDNFDIRPPKPSHDIGGCYSITFHHDEMIRFDILPAKQLLLFRSVKVLPFIIMKGVSLTSFPPPRITLGGVKVIPFHHEWIALISPLSLLKVLK